MFEHSFAMDFEIDSDLESPEEIEITEESFIRPYLFEPMLNSVVSGYSSNESSQETDATTSDSSDDENGTNDVSTWCHCGNCRNMDTAAECKCCQTTNVVDGKLQTAKISCITEHEGFQVNCLNMHVLETSYYDFILDRGPLEEGQLIHEVYRHIAYRRFTRWVYGLLGKKVRKVIPSCAVIAIRKRFPSEVYAGFKYPE